jgi:hypothetical protein
MVGVIDMSYLQVNPQNFENVSDLPLFHTAFQHEISFPQVIKPISKALEAVVIKPEPENKEILEVRRMLGEAGADLSTQEIKDMLTEIQFLVTSWLDEYEQAIFKGQTLAEVLHEKGSL